MESSPVKIKTDQHILQLPLRNKLDCLEIVGSQKSV